MKKTLKNLLLSGLVLGITSCDSTAPIEEFPSDFTQKPESERLRYFEEIGMKNVRETTGLTGKGIHITIMGEVVDASHPDLKNRVKKQYNAFINKEKLFTGKGNQPYGFDKLGMGDGHGTHIAGTIAAECDNIALQGVACGASLDVFDLGAYDSAKNFSLQNWGNDHEMTRFLKAFRKSVDEVTQQNKSKIITGSFNIEAPVQYLRQKTDNLENNN